MALRLREIQGGRAPWRPGPVGSPDRRTIAAAAFLFLLSLAACLVFVFAYPLPAVMYDSVEYLSLARSFAEGTGYSQDGGLTPAVYRPPLFSLLLGGWFRLTETRTVESAAVFQSILHAAGVLVSFALFLEILPSLKWAAGAAIFLAVNPLLITRVAFVFQETTLLLFTTLAAWLSVRLLKAPSTARAALAGAAWGACTLGKMVCWFAPFLLLAMRFLPPRLGWTWRRREAAVLVLCFASVIAPWTIRNYIHFHRFIPVNGQWEGMLEWNVSHAVIPGEVAGEEYAKEVYRKNLPEKERKALLWKYVWDHPYYFIVLRVVRNAIDFGLPPRDWWDARGYFRPGEHRAIFWTLTLLFHVPLYLFLLYRTSQWGRGLAPPAFRFVLLLYWTYWLEHAVLLGNMRFGLAVYPLLVGMVPPLACFGCRRILPMDGGRE
jgi:hypothetical protein